MASRNGSWTRSIAALVALGSTTAVLTMISPSRGFALQEPPPAKTRNPGLGNLTKDAPAPARLRRPSK